jgi:hypothetical protein
MHAISVDPVGRIALNPLKDARERASAWDLYEVREWARAFRSRQLDLASLDKPMRERVTNYLVKGDRQPAGKALPVEERVGSAA